MEYLPLFKSQKLGVLRYLLLVVGYWLFAKKYSFILLLPTPDSRLPRGFKSALSLQKLLKCCTAICQEATPKTWKKTIHRLSKRPSLQVDHFVPPLVGVLQLGN